jgi:hypothetical protein
MKVYKNGLMEPSTDLMMKSDTARTPWKGLAEESTVDDDHKKSITSEHAPPDWVWSDPFKLRKGKAKNLLEHWEKQERKGLPAVAFKGCRPIPAKRKNRDYVDVDDPSDDAPRRSSKSNKKKAKSIKRRKTHVAKVNTESENESGMSFVDEHGTYLMFCA